MLIKLPSSSYYDKHYRPSASLLRARQPFLIKNMLTAAGLFAWTIGVYAYTIHAVAQDDFSDVPMPDVPVQSPNTPHAGVERAGSEVVLNQRGEETEKR